MSRKPHRASSSVWSRRLGRAPEAPCYKVRYGNGALAHRALDDILANRVEAMHAGPLEQRAYDCPRCGFWHLTHQPYRRRPHRDAAPADAPMRGCAQPDGP